VRNPSALNATYPLGPNSTDVQTHTTHKALVGERMQIHRRRIEQDNTTGNQTKRQEENAGCVCACVRRTKLQVV